MLESVAARHLLEVLHTAFDERLIREVRDIAIEPSARTLGVAHLAEHTTIGTSWCPRWTARCRWVDRKDHRRLAIRIMTYCVATWPFAMSFSISSGLATKRPSPWLIATV